MQNTCNAKLCSAFYKMIWWTHGKWNPSKGEMCLSHVVWDSQPATWHNNNSFLASNPCFKPFKYTSLSRYIVGMLTLKVKIMTSTTRHLNEPESEMVIINKYKKIHNNLKTVLHLQCLHCKTDFFVIDSLIKHEWSTIHPRTIFTSDDERVELRITWTTIFLCTKT